MSGPPTMELRARLVSGVVSTDDILPARYKHSLTNPADLAPHVFENLLPGFARTLQPGDALVGDSLFGIGSSREQAVTSLMAAGVRAIIAPAFGRIFFRNAWNLGLVAIEIERLSCHDGDRIDLALESGTARTSHVSVPFRPIPREMVDIYLDGGLLCHVRKTLAESSLQSRARELEKNEGVVK